MRYTWLYCALCAILLCLVPYPLSWWLWLFLIPFLIKRQGFYCLIAFALLFILMIRIKPTAAEIPDRRTELHIIEIHSSYAIADYGQGRILLYEAADYGLDDVVSADISCEKLSSLKNFGLFDFSAYMKKRGITQSCQLNKGRLTAQGNTWRARMWQRVQSYDDSLKSWLKQTFYHIEDANAPSFELIGSTGIHLSLLLHCLTVVFSLWVSKRSAQSACLCIIVLIAHLTSWRDSLLRIFCFRLVHFLFPHMDMSDRLGISVLILLILRPYIVNELVFVLPFLFRFLLLFQKNSVPRLLYTCAVLIPLQFYYFHEVDVISLLMFSILRFFYMINYGCALITLLFPFALMQEIGTAVLSIVSSIEAFHLSFYYQASLCFILLWLSALLKLLQRRNIKAICALVMLLLYSQTAPYLRPYAQVLMLDVGQGDCTLISLPFHQGNILIDVAGSESRNIPKEIIVPALHAQGITSIDLLIITHDDLDHSGGLEQLQELMEVKRVITAKQNDVTFGNFHFQFLLAEKEFSDKNENSLITYSDLFGLRFLFMGDAGKQAETALMKLYPNLRADILKVGHHGSKSASSPLFLHSLHPFIGLISCGAHNFYGHPHQEVLTALANTRVKVLDTPHYGAVSIKITNIFQIYKTATHDFGIIKLR